MKERAFIADAREAKGLHDGSVTCLVRVVDKQPLNSRYELEFRGDVLYTYWRSGSVLSVTEKQQSPFGVVGDRLFVQEDYIIAQTGHSTLNGAGGKVSLDPATLYRADGHDTVADAVNHVRGMTDVDGWETESDTWRFAEGAPRKASRTLLDVTDVRVVRAQEVTGQDALAAGMTSGCRWCTAPGACAVRDVCEHPRDEFREHVGHDVYDANKYLWLATVAKTEEVSA